MKILLQKVKEVDYRDISKKNQGNAKLAGNSVTTPKENRYIYKVKLQIKHPACKILLKTKMEKPEGLFPLWLNTATTVTIIFFF